MQGRLSPSPSGRIQEFPRSTWEREFALARECGFDSIEWVFEAENHIGNPLWTDGGVDRIRRVATTSGVDVLSVCADYFMSHPLTASDHEARLEALRVLRRLIEQSAAVGAERVVIPVLEHAGLHAKADTRQLEESLRDALGIAAEHGLELALETELTAQEAREFVGRFDALPPRVLYDLGNSAALGYDAACEIRLLGAAITEVHVKDRIRGGQTVPLGTGDTDLAGAFAALHDIGFRGPYVLQAAPGNPGREAETAAAYLRLVRHLLEAAEPGPAGHRAS